MTPSIDKLFVANKPKDISSNRFLSKIKRKYEVKKAGFSGTLDPFADGVLIIAFGKYTKLFQFLNKAPKVYEATLWLGIQSETLDIEKISKVSKIDKLNIKDIKKVLDDLHGDITYLPPKYSAKKINGVRAYKLARNEEEVKLEKITSTIYKIQLLHYNHPFIKFKISISEGGYIRSIAEIISNKLNVTGALSSLTRLHEGKFTYNKEKPLDPLKYLNIKQNYYLKRQENISLGKKLKKEDFKIQNQGKYFVKLDNMFAILEIRDDKVSYLLNGVSYVDIGTKEG